MTFFSAGIVASAGGLFTTWNPSDKSASITLTNGNLTEKNTVNGTTGGVRGVLSFSGGNATIKVLIGGDSGTTCSIGAGNSSATLADHVGNDNNGIGYFTSNGIIRRNGSALATATFGGATQGDTIEITIGSGTFTVTKNGGTPYVYTGSLPTGTLYPMVAEACSTGLSASLTLQ